MSCITITFGDCAENHKGMQIIGNSSLEGYNLDNLIKIKEKFEKKFKNTDVICEIIDLTLLLDNNDKEKVETAYILILRQGINKLIEKYNLHMEDVFNELKELDWDKKFLMYGKVVNKRARYNLCFSDKEQEPDYEQGKGRIIKWKDVPILKKIKKRLKKIIEDINKLEGEGNYYYDITKTGIAYHCDLERKKVIGVRLGNNMPLCFQWFNYNKPIGNNLEINLDGGDIYIMNEIAKGIKPNNKNKYILKHSAGCKKYTLYK